MQKRVWINALSPYFNAWGYSSGYNVSSTENHSAILNGTYKGISFSVGVSRSDGISGAYLANPAFGSMLGVWQDLEFKTYRVDVYMVGAPVPHQSFITITVAKRDRANVRTCYKSGSASPYPKCFVTLPPEYAQ